MQNNQLYINNSNDVGRFKQYTQTIKAGDIYTFQQPFNNFRLLDESTEGAFTFYFGGTSEDTPLNAGIGVSFPDVLPYVRIRNNTAQDQNITFTTAVGLVFDDRLKTQGTIEVKQKPYSIPIVTEHTVGATGILEIVPAVARKVLVQNTGSGNIRLFNATGMIIVPMGTYEEHISGSFNIYGSEGGKVVVAVYQ